MLSQMYSNIIATSLTEIHLLFVLNIYELFMTVDLHSSHGISVFASSFYSH